MTAITNQQPESSYPINVAHMIEYFTKGIDAQGPYYRVDYLIDSYTNTDAFVNFLLGYASATGSGPSTAYTRRAPHQHPLSPNLYCRSADVIEGYGAPVLNAAGFPMYSKGAKIRCEYRPWPPGGPPEMTPNELLQQIDPATPLLWCTQTIDVTTETYLIPNQMLQFTATSKPTGMPFKLSIPLVNMNLTFHFVPYMPITPLRTAAAAPLNSATFLGATLHTVLFKGGNTVREFQSDGTVAQKLQLTFSQRPSDKDWNSLPDNTFVWQQVSSVTGAHPPYAASDLNALVIF